MKRAKIIAFTGIDGSGKTSISLALTEALEEQNYKTKYIHTNAPTFLDYFVRRKALNRTERPSTPTSLFMPWLIGVKDFLTILFRVTPNLLGNDFVVCDRHILDTIAKLRYEWGKIGWLEKFLLILKPTYLFLLEAPPQITNKRDQDHSFDYHCKKRELYLQVFEEIKNEHAYMISSDKDLSQIKNEILSRLLIAANF